MCTIHLLAASQSVSERNDYKYFFLRAWEATAAHPTAADVHEALNFKLGTFFTEAYAMLKEVYGNECLSRTQVFEWFKEGREMTEDDPHPRRPSMSKTDENIEKICKLIREDRRLNIAEGLLK
ncbi:hypothetical protein NQ318_013762 [Aromia moschata]|uniref:Mos1 transposase HTH domain-containing protein n=1 Tax=Aromia moschata TaxID=1265417 RepID=A0AAV8Z911_9CUCU|nr:hypothetical protein NQ318_013762 [Aromia moschata]